MKIKIITVGKIKEQSWRTAEADYCKRIGRYTQLEDIFVKDAPADSIKNVRTVMDLEAKSILSKINENEFTIALDRQGKQLSSQEFAKFFNSKMLHGTNKITFVVGGALGLSETFRKEADFILSFSKMTLPHELSKVVLLEQIYRAFSILKGGKYHK